MIKKISLVFLLATITNGLFAQQLDLKWSNKLEYNNSDEGFFDDLIGENDKYVYGKYTANRNSGSIYKLMIVAFDKNSMQQKKKVKILGFEENKSQAKKYDDLKLYKTVVYEDVLYIFWYKVSKDKEELFVQSFDEELKVKKQLEKVYEVKNYKKYDKTANLFVLANKNVGDGIILIGAELAGQAGENVKLEYKVLNSEFKVLNTNQVTLDMIKIKEARRGLFGGGPNGNLSSSYTLGSDGNIHLNTGFSYSRKEIKEMKENGEYENAVFRLFSIIDTKTGALTSKELKFENKNIFNIWKTTGSEYTAIHGFYSDKTKDPNGGSINGIFYAKLNSNYEVISVQFNEFKQELLDEIFQDDMEDRYEKKNSCLSGACCFFGSKNKDETVNDREKLTNDYMIKNIITVDGEMYVFCVRSQKWEHTHCSPDANGNQTCTTTYYNKQKNVTVFKLDDEGKLIWGSNLNRYILYSGGIQVWYYQDFNVINSDDGFYMIYGSAYDHSGGKMKRKKITPERPFEYAYLSKEDGKFKRMNYNVNMSDTKRRDIRVVDPTEIQVVNSKFYAHYSKVTPKLYARICCILPYVSRNQSLFKGFGYIGEIKPKGR